MPQIGDVARIRDVSTPAPNVPDVDSPEGLQAAARLVYQVVHEKLTAKSPVKQIDGTPGKMWQGRIQAEVIYTLWPGLDDRMYTSRERSKEIADELFSYLLKCKIMICRQRSSQYNPAVWWVSDHWSPMEVRTVQSEPAAAMTTPDPVAAEEENYTCRMCSKEFKTPNSRGVHEYQMHQMAYDSEGTGYAYDLTFTTEVMESVILDVLGGVDRALTFRAVAIDSHEMDPRMGKATVERVLAGLLKQDRVRLVHGGVYPKYALAETVSDKDAETARLLYNMGTETPAEQATPEAEEQAEEQAASEPETAESVRGDGLTTVLEGLLHIVSTAKGQLDSVATAAVAVADHSRARIAELERELHVVNTKLMTRARAPEVESLNTAVRELTAELEQVTMERDEVQRLLDNFQQALRGLGVK